MGTIEQEKSESLSATEILGELTALTAQLGAPDVAELTQVSPEGELCKIRNLPELRRFLKDLVTHSVVARELPVILRAFQHAQRGESRELIALDAGLQSTATAHALSSASQRVGRSQLRKLRPLRDERTVQRYLAAVERGEASAWHTIVYGLVLALFSMPLRQGLLHYASQTLNGFVQSAAGRLGLTTAACEELVDECARELSTAIDGILRMESPELKLIS